MPKTYLEDNKIKILEGNRTLNKHAGKVKDPIFRNNPFFDSRDIVQVKYEMLRAVEKDGQPVSTTAESFGFSRVSFYKTMGEFKGNGVMGLIPKKRGPQGAYKLNPEAMNFINKKIRQYPGITKKQLVEALETATGVKVHKRSIERALGGSKKKRYKEL
jgi:transposase